MSTYTNVTLPNGLTYEINTAISNGDTSFILACTALVMLMTPGLGFFYSGLARQKNALSLIFLSGLSLAIVSIEWFIWGYSLALSNGPNTFIGDLRWGVFGNVAFTDLWAGGSVSNAAYMVYQCMFAAITPALAFGAAAERTRIPAAILFIFIWTTIVYNPIAYWTWAPNGWLNFSGGIIKTYDFAGGTPVHINSGMAALAYSLAIGKRRGHGEEIFHPHSISQVFLGTALLWFGWLGFNGGSAAAANARAVNGMIVTNLAASVGGITWMVLDYRHQRKWASLGFCSGAVAALVAITPASGYVSPASSIAIGALGAAACNLAVSLKHRFHFDDALDVFSVHGIGGIVGNLLTGIFAQKYIAGLDMASSIDGGWLDGHYVQLGNQLVGVVCASAWSFCLTYIILKVIDMIPGLSLRVDEESEFLGVDLTEMGEVAYDIFPSEVKLSEVVMKHAESRKVLLESTQMITQISKVNDGDSKAHDVNGEISKDNNSTGKSDASPTSSVEGESVVDIEMKNVH